MSNPKTEDVGVVVATLKKRYFEVVAKEDYPHTPKLTQEADKLEAAIRRAITEDRTNPA